MINARHVRFLAALFLLLVLASCSRDDGATTSTNTAGACAPNSVAITIVYAPESASYLPQVMSDFNDAYRNGRNPVTGQALASGEQSVCITGESGSSGTTMQGIVNAVIAPNNSNVVRPTIFEPSVSHWLVLANYQSGRQIFDLSTTQATALAPVVMAIWESRLQAIRNTIGRDDVGWQDLLDVLNSPNGWQDYGISGRRTVYYGHTDPLVSSTALSTLISEFYAAARANGFTGRRLTSAEVRDPNVQNGVRQIEELIRHYSTRTTEFRNYIAQGPDYLDFVALEENDLVYINQGRTSEGVPPERLVALYPSEGTFWHEHPMGIVNASWTTPEQRTAAQSFVDYVLTTSVQQRIMVEGFRPANPNVPLDYPLVMENGVDVNQPRTVLDVPAPDVIAAIQQSWSFVKKQADIMLLIDVSGSMNNEAKIDQAIAAAQAFLSSMDSNNRIGLATFSTNLNIRVPLDDYETNQQQLNSQVRSLRADGGTELYGAVRDVVDYMNQQGETDRIRAVVLLSDGEDTGDKGVTLNDAIAALEASHNDLNPVILVPVAYGSDADINALNALARASATRIQSGDPANIVSVLELISSYF
ncbi:MAG: VWA domain-containing protein [Anaerolineae bacterium]